MGKPVFAVLSLVLFLVAGLASRAQNIAPDTKPGTVFRDCATCPEMVVIPAGNFVMGATAEEVASFPSFEPLKPGHTPQHKVTLAKPFALGRYELTKGEFAAFVRDTGYQTGSRCMFTDLGIDGHVTTQVLSNRDWRYPPWQSLTDRYPVTCVNHLDAAAYVRWLARKTGKKYRLPSEAEWEYAARAGTTTHWYWGNDPQRSCQYENLGDLSFIRVRRTMETATVPTMQTYGGAAPPTKNILYFDCDDGYYQLAPVGAFKPNPWGLYDMLGNVHEKLADCWHHDYTGAPSDGSVWDSPDCFRRVERGDGNTANTGIAMSYSAHRYGDLIDENRTNLSGFRIARDL